jgi:polysaccharide transporter, PST family
MDRAALDNMAWLAFNKLVRLGGGLVIGIWLARHLGPEAFGLLSYAVALTAVFAVLASMGLHEVLVRECVTRADLRGEILGTALMLHCVSGVVAWVAIMLVIHVIQPGQSDMQALIVIVSLGLLVQASSVIKAWFEARVHARPVVVVEVSVFLVVSAIKCGLIVFQAPVQLFAWVIATEAGLVSLGLLLLLGCRVRPLIGLSVSGAQAGRLLRAAWPLMLSGLAIMVYTRTDQLMLGGLLDAQAVGLYSAALWLSEGWYIVPVIAVSSVFPGLLLAGRRGGRGFGPAIDSADMQRLLDWLVVTALALAVVISSLAPWLMGLLFGQAYAAAATVLQLHVWAVVFVFLGVAGHKWLLAEHLQRLVLYRTVVGAGVNVGLNLLLIPRWGIDGAALATLITQAFVSVGFDSFHARTRPLFTLNCRALAFGPLRVGSTLWSVLRRGRQP